MANYYSGIFLHFEGTTSECDTLQRRREIMYDTASGLLRYKTCSDEIIYVGAGAAGLWSDGAGFIYPTSYGSGYFSINESGAIVQNYSFEAPDGIIPLYTRHININLGSDIPDGPYGIESTGVIQEVYKFTADSYTYETGFPLLQKRVYYGTPGAENIIGIQQYTIQGGCGSSLRWEFVTAEHETVHNFPQKTIIMGHNDGINLSQRITSQAEIGENTGRPCFSTWMYPYSDTPETTSDLSSIKNTGELGSYKFAIRDRAWDYDATVAEISAKPDSPTWASGRYPSKLVFSVMPSGLIPEYYQTASVGSDNFLVDILTLTSSGVHMPYLKSGTSQANAQAVAGELWYDTGDGNTVKMGV